MCLTWVGPTPLSCSPLATASSDNIMKSRFVLLLFLNLLAPGVSGAADEPKVYVAPTPPQSAPAAVANQMSAAPVSPAASPAPPPSAAPKVGTNELEKLVMPIALHPDPLIAIILPASAYPLEIVQAARFVKDTNNIPKLDSQPWDENVKAVAKFPEMIAKMDADLPWTMKLGQAFIDQPKELMDTIQDLRAKAQKAGTLRSSDQQIVTVTNIVVMQTNINNIETVTREIVQVAPANPQVIYVPSYPPAVYYPPPAYVYNPYAPLVTFGVGMAMGAIIANNCDWHGGCVWHGGGDVDIDVNRNVNRNSNRTTNRGQANSRNGATGASAGQTKWQPNQSRLQSSGAASTSSRDARGWSGGSGAGAGARPSTGNVGARPSTGSAGARPSTGNVGVRPSGGASASSGGGAARPSTAASRPSPSPSTSRSPSSSSFGGSSRSSSGSSAFSGVSSGSSSRSYSSRGASSRSGGFSGGGGRGGGGGRR